MRDQRKADGDQFRPINLNLRPSGTQRADTGFDSRALLTWWHRKDPDTHTPPLIAAGSFHPHQERSGVTKVNSSVRAEAKRHRKDPELAPPTIEHGVFSFDAPKPERAIPIRKAPSKGAKFREDWEE
jgi:hypothetical protein